MTATTTVHLPKPVSTNLTIKPDSVLTNPIGKDGGVKLVDVKHLPHKDIFIVAPSLEAWPTKTKEDPSSHEVKKIKNKIAPNKLVTQSEIFYFLTFS